MTAIYRWGPSSMRTLFSGLKKYLLAVTDEFSFSPTSSKDYPVITINDHLFEPVLCFIFFIYATSKMLGWDEWSNQRLLVRHTTNFDFVFHWPRKWLLTTSCKNTWDTLPYFRLTGLFIIFSLWYPLLAPLIKFLLASGAGPSWKLGGVTWIGGEVEGEYYISRTCDSQGFKLRKVAFSSECLNIFATGCMKIGERHKIKWHPNDTKVA